MKKSDLETGMIVETRKGEMGLIALDNCYGEDAILFNENSWTPLSGFSEDFIWHPEDRTNYTRAIDIVKVFEPNLPSHFLNFDCKKTLLWERTPEKTFELDGIEYSESTLRSMIKKATE